MRDRFGIRMARTVGVAVVSLLLVVGGAFAANNIANTSRVSNESPIASATPETAEPTESPEPSKAAETAEPTEGPDASGDQGGDNQVEDGASGDQGDQGPSAEPTEASGGNGGSNDGSPDSSGDTSGHG